MSKDLELFLLKNKLNEKSLMDFIDKFTPTTIKLIMKDLAIIEEVKDNDKMYVFCDGGSKKNGKIGACAAYSVLFNDNKDNPLFKFNKTERITGNQTNNVAELTGIKEIFKIINENAELFKNKEVIIYSDSQYSIDCIEKWSKNWIKNGWINSKKEPVKNKELIQEILEFKKTIGNLNVKIKHIFSHLQEPKNKDSLEWFTWNGNNIVDKKINELINN